jgi:hypothetical protein
MVRNFLLALVGAAICQTQAAEKGTANFYQSAPQDYLGKEIRLRVASLTPVPEFTAVDTGYVWMEAVGVELGHEELIVDNFKDLREVF